MHDESVKRKVGWVFQELNSLYESTTIDVRAENAFGVAVRFFQLIIKMVPEELEQKKLMAAFFKSVRDNDFRKFRRSLRRYDRLVKQGETDHIGMDEGSIGMDEGSDV